MNTLKMPSADVIKLLTLFGFSAILTITLKLAAGTKIRPLVHELGLTLVERRAFQITKA